MKIKYMLSSVPSARYAGEITPTLGASKASVNCFFCQMCDSTNFRRRKGFD